jgi:hypothetical protein
MMVGSVFESVKDSLLMYLRVILSIDVTVVDIFFKKKILALSRDAKSARCRVSVVCN